MKSRVKSVLNYKKPAFWMILIAIVASSVVAVCFLTDPASNTLENIEFLNFAARRENTVSVLISDGETYTPVGTVSEDLLKELCEIKISRNEISRNRSEDRDKRHTLVLQTEQDTEPTIHSYAEGWHIHFNSTFTSVWVNNNVKPTLSYRVIDPLKAKQIYEDIANCVNNEKLTWTYSPMLSYTGHSFFPFEFDFEYSHIIATCDKGMMQNLEADGQPKDTTLRFEKGQHIYWTPDEAVIETLPETSEVTFRVYNGDDDRYSATVVFECVARELGSADFDIYLEESNGLILTQKDGVPCFVEDNNSSVSNVGGADHPDWQLIIDAATFDIDGDGKDEECTLNHGPTSGLHTFKLSVWDVDSGFEYCNIFLSEPGALSFVETDEGMKLRLVPQGKTQSIDYSFRVKDGNIVLTADGESLGYWGEQGVGTPHSAVHNSAEVYEATPIDELEAKIDNEEFVIHKLHYKAADGTWACEGYTYKYRLEITGRRHNAAMNTTYLVLSNSKDITFGQTWKASGLSSLMSDYFDPEEAVIVGYTFFS